jgi:hypothetical protein
MRIFIVTLTILSIIFFSSMKIDSQVEHYRITQDSLQASRDKYINEVKEKIKGKEQMAVDSVFKNLKVFG